MKILDLTGYLPGTRSLFESDMSDGILVFHGNPIILLRISCLFL